MNDEVSAFEQCFSLISHHRACDKARSKGFEIRHLTNKNQDVSASGLFRDLWVRFAPFLSSQPCFLAC